METVKENNVFKAVVEATDDIRNAYCKGLHALKHVDAAKITSSDMRKVDGSVDIDNAVKVLYPNESRWDYAIGYDSQVCFVEVHPAYTSEIENLINKYVWLLKWLKNKAPQLDNLPKMTPAYVWLQSGKCAILPTSRQAKKLAAVGMPRPTLKLG